MGLYAGRGIHGKVVGTVGRRIVSGYHQSGDVLLADALGSDLGVSKTVVREALKVLAAKGLVDSRPKLGTVVRERSSWNLLDPDLVAWQGQCGPSQRFLRDLAEVRAAVEPTAARLAAKRRDDDDLRRLRRALRAMAGAGDDGNSAIEADLAFHEAMLFATHNELLGQMRMLVDPALRVRDELLHRQTPWLDPLPEHQEVFEAIVAGNGGRAAAAMAGLLERAAREASERAEMADFASAQELVAHGAPVSAASSTSTRPRRTPVEEPLA